MDNQDNSNNKRYVFGIGLNKTGSSSLHRAMELLGYNSVHYIYNDKILKDIVADNISNKKNIFDGIKNIDCYFDYLPWISHRSEFPLNHLYKTIDKQYPNSLFIYNTRNINDWLESRYRHIERVTNADLSVLSKQHPHNIYFNRDKQAWTEEYIDLDLGIKEYFFDRPNDLLIIDICNGDGWDKLCTFLNKPIPNQQFPWVNKGS